MTNFIHNIFNTVNSLLNKTSKSVKSFFTSSNSEFIGKKIAVRIFAFLLVVCTLISVTLTYSEYSEATDSITAVANNTNDANTEYVVSLIETVEETELVTETVAISENYLADVQKQKEAEEKAKAEEAKKKAASQSGYVAPKSSLTEGFVYYDHIKLSYDWQLYTYNLCKEYNVSYEIMLGLMYAESSFKLDNVNYNGTCFGVCQIHQCHDAYAKSIGIKNFKEPAGNIRLAVQFISGYLKTYNGDYHKALICYNYGTGGAKKHCFNKGIYQTSYSKKVINYANNLVSSQ